MKEGMAELLKNEDFCVKFFDTLEDMTGLNMLLKENGVVLDDEELHELVEVTKAQIAKEECGELNEEDLEDVSGGYVALILFTIAVITAYRIYKIKTRS